MVTPGQPQSRSTLIDLAIAVITSRPEWLAVCCWCLGVICRPTGGGQWHHVHHGFLVCSHPLPGAPPYTMAYPLPGDDMLDHLRPLLLPPTAWGGPHRCDDDRTAARVPGSGGRGCPS